MHIVIQGIIHEYKQDLRIYFDNVCGFVQNTQTEFFFIVDPAQLCLFSWIFLLLLLHIVMSISPRTSAIVSANSGGCRQKETVYMEQPVGVANAATRWQHDPSRQLTKWAFPLRYPVP